MEISFGFSYLFMTERGTGYDSSSSFSVEEDETTL